MQIRKVSEKKVADDSSKGKKLVPANGFNTGDFEIERFDFSVVPPNPYRAVDFAIVARYPGEIVAIYENGDGIIYSPATGEPIHARTQVQLVEMIEPGIEWTFVSAPKAT